MIGVALKGLLGRKLRTVLTALAIVLGVSMISGTYVLTDTITGAFTSIVDKSYENADAVITGKVAFKNTNSNTEQTPAFPAAVLAKVRQLPQVDAAAGEISDEVDLVGRDGKIISSGGAPPLALSVDARGDQRFNALTLSAGHWPVGSGQIAIDEKTSQKKSFSVGDNIGVATDEGVRQLEVVGIAKFAAVSSIGGATIAIFDVPTAQEIFHKLGKFDEVQVAGKQGVSPEALANQIRPLLPPTAKVKTAEAQTGEAVDEINTSLGVVQKFLLAFGGIALFVGSFVIANTLSITIAQRMREFATLRTIGGSRRQVLKVVMLEAFVVGAIASVLGLVVGILITLLASLRPALRATRVPPIAAVREGSVLPKSRFSRFGPATALTVLVLGIAMLVYGVLGHGVAIGLRLLLLGLGVLLMFVGVALNAPRLVPPLASALGWPGTKIGGAAGKLARDNAIRNPSRTASTAAALMIGLALVTFVAIFGAGLRSSFESAVDDLFVADYALTSSNTFTPMSVEAEKAVRLSPA